MLNTPQNIRRSLTMNIRIVPQARNTRERSWEDQEARKQDPGEEGSEDVVQTWYCVEGEKHIHVACLD